MMRTKLVSLVALSMLAPALALAQAPPTETAKSGQRPQMYEDIEIMRKLLNQRLGVSGQAWQPNGYYLYSAQPSVNLLDRVMPHSAQPNQFGGQLHNQLFNQPYSAGFAGSTSAASRSEAEGVYLKGHGVVYTITLAPSAHDPRPTADKAPVKAASDWDRTKSEVRGEKLPPPKAAEAKSGSVADTILKLLADNGHHFSQLGAEESLIVVVTFRGTGAAGGQAKTGKEELIRRVYLDLTGTVPTAEEVKAFLQDDRDDAYQKLVEGLLNDSKPRTAAPATNDHEVLGDLHMKQGKAKEAIEAYQKAMEKDPKRDVLLNKLIQANVAANNYAKAQDLLKNAKEQPKQPTAPTTVAAKPPTATAPVLPAKLLISAPKKLLDLAGGGKITFDEFKKAATVEYLTFPPAAAEKK